MGIPIIPRGAGTGLEGGALPIRGGVVVNVMRLRMLDLRVDDLMIICGPGWHKLEICKLVEEKGLLLGPDPASNPSIGGMAATAGSGLTTLRYGTSRENLVSLQVVLPSGELMETKRVVRKSSAGYDLTQLIAGSEGTLGVIVQLAWRLHVKPKQRVGSLIAFDNLRSAADCVVAFRHTDSVFLLRCECLNAAGIRATNKKFKTMLAENPTLFLEFSGDYEEYIIDEAKRFEEIAKAHHCISYTFARDGGIDDLWDARRGCYFAAKAWNGRSTDEVYCGDACVPLSKLPRAIEHAENIILGAGFPPIICAHIADGNFHLTVPYQAEDKARLVDGEHEVLDMVLGLGGTCTGEHGVGMGKMQYMIKEHGSTHVNVMRSIKHALDPLNIMNPGKLFPEEARL